jgi:hypothetical protein
MSINKYMCPCGTHVACLVAVHAQETSFVENAIDGPLPRQASWASRLLCRSGRMMAVPHPAFDAPVYPSRLKICGKLCFTQHRRLQHGFSRQFLLSWLEHELALEMSDTAADWPAHHHPPASYCSSGRTVASSSPSSPATTS